MYKCNNCNSSFEEANRKNICFEEHYGVGTLFVSRNYTDMFVCPNCEDEDIEELEQCEICEEWFRSEQLTDTTEYVNGGCGYCCEQCMEDAEMVEI